MRNRGFTIIELMIAIAILGVLAAIAVPAYQDYIKRSKVVEGLTLAETVQNAAVEYYQLNNSFPGESASSAADVHILYKIAAPTDITGNYVQSVSGQPNGSIDIVYNNQIDPTNNILVLTPVPNPNSGTISWTCAPAATNGINVKYLPSTCKAVATK